MSDKQAIIFSLWMFIGVLALMLAYAVYQIYKIASAKKQKNTSVEQQLKIDEMIYGMSVYRIDHKGNKIRIDPTKIRIKDN